jgi:uncharacterized protein YecE (DUF72 family)
MLRIGTCSWKYPSWKGLVYSDPAGYRGRAAGIDYLAEYASRYDTVEVDQWFWAAPEKDTAAQYASVTPPDFRFTIKLPNALTLTHLYRRKGEAEAAPNPDFLSVPVFEDILERLSPLQGKIGMLMLQFEYLNARKMASPAAFLDALGRFAEAAPRTLPLAVEPRNPSWVDERWFSFLEQHRLSHVFLDGYYMPPLAQTWKRVGGRVRGAAVVRLHGPDREGMERATGESWDRIIAPKDAELDRVVDMINDMRGRSMTIYLNVNNHYEGSAPLTIERLVERLRKGGVEGLPAGGFLAGAPQAAAGSAPTGAPAGAPRTAADSPGPAVPPRRAADAGSQLLLDLRPDLPRQE